jgi:ribosome-binding factor A
MSLRLERVREMLKRELGEIIRREIPLTEAGLITVNEVGVAADLKSAVVYVGVIGTPEQRKRAGAILEKEAKRFQGMIGRAVVLKYTPHLKFVVDESIERGNRVLEILEQLEKSESSAQPLPNEGPSQNR